jgi:L1 cell adhesion molecule like protein
MRAHEPKIEISYDLDANGILTVTAVEKSTGKSNNLVIKSEKGRLSKDEIEKKIQEAEKYKEEDEKRAQVVESKNMLENYCYTCKRTLEDEKLKDEFTDEEKTSVNTKMDETLQWLSQPHEV